MSDGVVDAISRPRRSRERFVADEEVKVFGAPFPREMTTGPSTARQERWLVRDSRTPRPRTTRAARRTFGSYRSGEDERGRIIARETCHTELSML